MPRADFRVYSCLLLCGMLASVLSAQEKTAERSSERDAENQKLATATQRLLNHYCRSCHKGPGSAAAFDVGAAKSLIENDVVIPGNSKESRLWLLTHLGTMPPRAQTQLVRPTPEESETIADWIDAGAPEFPPTAARVPVSLNTTLKLIRDDLQKMRNVTQRSETRYFTLATMHNSPKFTAEALELASLALAKTANSLSWKPEVVIPRAVDEDKSLWAIDISQLGWSRAHWSAVRSQYPYAIGFQNLDNASGKELQTLETEILSLTNNAEPLYLVRLDWFVTASTQPKLYHRLLYDLALPELIARQANSEKADNPLRMTAVDLEQFLGVDIPASLKGAKAAPMRSGFTSSGVSAQNRLLERHASNFGAYWKSYDFKAKNRRGILSQFPLGPEFDGNNFQNAAFQHDGGEIIFNLPNGLQAYLLVDAQDNRIDEGPVEVVNDALKTSGSPLIVNAISCMSCHRLGIIEPPADEIALSARLFGDERAQLERLYPTPSRLEEKWQADRQQYVTAMEKLVKALTPPVGDKPLAVAELAEPISETARAYLSDELDLETAAAELFELNPQRFQAAIENNELLKKLGLRVLLPSEGKLASGKIKRAYWESIQGGASVMQMAATALDYTAPQFRE